MASPLAHVLMVTVRLLFSRSLGVFVRVGEVEFEDRRYEVGPPPDYDKSEWLNAKEVCLVFVCARSCACVRVSRVCPSSHVRIQHVKREREREGERE